MNTFDSIGNGALVTSVVSSQASKIAIADGIGGLALNVCLRMWVGLGAETTQHEDSKRVLSVEMRSRIWAFPLDHFLPLIASKALQDTLARYFNFIATNNNFLTIPAVKANFRPIVLYDTSLSQSIVPT